MAERRMFSKLVAHSEDFLTMSAAARLLYFDLGLGADDDGCVEPFWVMRMTDAPQEALNELTERGFLVPLDRPNVYYIRDWRRNNQIRRDRYHPGLYKAMAASVEKRLGIETPDWQASGLG